MCGAGTIGIEVPRALVLWRNRQQQCLRDRCNSIMPAVTTIIYRRAGAARLVRSTCRCNLQQYRLTWNEVRETIIVCERAPHGIPGRRDVNPRVQAPAVGGTLLHLHGDYCHLLGREGLCGACTRTDIIDVCHECGTVCRCAGPSVHCSRQSLGRAASWELRHATHLIEARRCRVPLQRAAAQAAADGDG